MPNLIKINFTYCWLSLRPHCDPGIVSASNRNEYQEYFLGVKGGRCIVPKILPPVCADVLEVWYVGSLNLLESSGLVLVCTGIAVLLAQYVC